MLAALKRNRLQVAGISLQGIASVIPEINVAMAPFLFRSEGEVDFVYDTVLLQSANELLEPHGLVLLRWLESGWFSIGSQVPIRSPENIRGLKIGGSPNVAIQRFLTSVEADAVPIASVDLVQALQTGLIDGAIKPTALIYTNLQDEIVSVSLVKFAYDTGGLLANRAWAKNLLSEEYESLVHGHGPSASVRGEVRALVKEQIEQLSNMGKEVITIDDTGRLEWENQSRSVHQEIINAIGPSAQVVYDEIQNAIEQYRSGEKQPKN